MGKRGRRGLCRLCGVTASLTNEDVYSTWLRKFVRHNLMASDQRIPPKVTLRACEDCNRELGRVFENPVAPLLKPLIAGKETTLTPVELKAVANWLWLKDVEYVLMRDQIWRHGQAGRPITTEDIDLWQGRLGELRRTQHPPAGYVVRMGVIGCSADPTLTARVDPFLPAGFATEFTGITSFNNFGLATFQTTLTGARLAAELTRVLASDDRTTVLWPAPPTLITVPKVRLPYVDAVRWVGEFGFHPESNIRAGFQLAVPAQPTA